jgi:hypothetical protein
MKVKELMRLDRYQVNKSHIAEQLLRKKLHPQGEEDAASTSTLKPEKKHSSKLQDNLFVLLGSKAGPGHSDSSPSFKKPMAKVKVKIEPQSTIFGAGASHSSSSSASFESGDMENDSSKQRMHQDLYRARLNPFAKQKTKKPQTKQSQLNLISNEAVHPNREKSHQNLLQLIKAEDKAGQPDNRITLPPEQHRRQSYYLVLPGSPKSTSRRGSF